jgi:uncharacterized membrane protein YedE/YeeE
MKYLRELGVFLCGFLFAIGLGTAGMTRPSVVIGFLDVFGRWDSSLGWVMIAALAITMLLFPAILRMDAPLYAQEFRVPRARKIDRDLVLGSVLFGIGWGVGGFCPGPAIVAIASGSYAAGEFLCAMIAGMVLWELLIGPRRDADASC